MNPGKTYLLFDHLESAIFTYTIVYLLFILGFWMLGKWFNHLLIRLDTGKSFWTGIFFELLIGLGICTIAFAIFNTGGKTALLGMLVFGAASFYWTKKEQPKFVSLTQSKIFHSSSILFVLSLLIFLPFAWFKIPYSEVPFPGVMGDYLYYSEISEFCYTTGNENIYGVSNLFSPAYQGVSPYHYFDIWLNSLIAECTNLPYVSVEESIDWAIFRLLVTIGFLAIVEKHTQITWGTVVACFLLMFICGYFPPVFSTIDFLKFNNKLLQSIVDGKKIAATIPFFIGFYLLWVNKSQNSALLILMAGSFASIGNSLGISFGIFAWGCFLLWRKDNKNALFCIFLSFLGVSTIGAFYSFFGADLPAIDYGMILNHCFQNPISKFKFLLSYGITILIYNILLVTLGIYFLVKNSFRFNFSHPSVSAGMILCGILAGGALSAALFTGEFQDGDQFLMNVYIPALCILLLMGVLYLHKILKIQQRLFSIILVCISIYAAWSGINTLRTEKINSEFWASNYSAAYLKKVSAALKSIRNPIGASINRISSDPFYHKKYYIYNPLGYYMKTMAKGYNTVGLSHFEICTQCPGFQFLCQRDQFAFYTYAKNRILTSSGVSIPSLQSTFINEFRIEYLIVESGAYIPNEIKLRLQLIATDAESGESFYLISPS